ncbi:hypothetical protein EDM76_11350 [bacterium]|nr:MAG: hypothetical protein EDM76_11350 [bacterium]
MTTNTNQDNFLATADAHGGLVRVSFSKPGTDTDGSRAGHTERMAKVSERVQTREGGAASLVQTTSAPAIEGIAADGRIASARSQYGSARTGASITEGDLIDLGGLQVRIKDAIAAGVVVTNPDGSFSLAGGAKGQSGKR